MGILTHATGWTSASPSPAQIAEFFRQIESGRISKGSLQILLQGKEELLGSPLNLVGIYFENEKEPRTFIVTSKDLPKFVTATLQLHHDPGINPYNGGKAAKVVKITSRALMSAGPYWWSTPGLKDGLFSKGATVWDWNVYEKVIWEPDTT